MKRYKKFIIAGAIALPVILIIIACAVFLPTYGNYISHSLSGELSEKKLKNAGIEECDKLMIVAHPDDEVIWGGAHLSEGGYFVLCLTNGDNPTRSAEFEALKQAVGYRGLILSYPDKVAGERSEWKHLKNSITKDLTLILSIRDWELVVTHNPEGEYGHIHHKMTNALVTSVCKNANYTDKLMYFGKYYGKNEVPEDLDAIDSEALKKKEENLTLYVSQTKTIAKFAHMIPHEQWQAYKDIE